MQPISSSYVKPRCSGQAVALKENLGSEARLAMMFLHVDRAASVDAAVGDVRHERIGIPRLPVNGNDIGVPA